MSSVSRTRRDMITQQMRNQKRQRASPQQSAYLKKMFMRNSKPDHRAREEIGRRIDMTPRSVQIWFQNNRAKTKHQNLSSHMPTVTTSCNKHVSSVQLDYRAMTPLSSSRSNINLLVEGREGGGLGRRGTAPSLRHSASQNALASESVCDDQNLLISCHSLAIGSWRRTRSLNRFETDLHVACDMPRGIIYYCVLYDHRWFRVEMFLMDISNMTLHYDSEAEGLGHLTLTVSALPVFASRAAYESEQWVGCGDFTNGAASTSKQHVLSGPYRRLEEQLARIRMVAGSNGGVEKIDPLLFVTNDLADAPVALDVPAQQYANLKVFGEDESIESKINRLSNPFEHMQLTENPPADLVGLLMANETLYENEEEEDLQEDLKEEEGPVMQPSFSSASLSSVSERQTPATPALIYPFATHGIDTSDAAIAIPFQWENGPGSVSPQTAPSLTVTNSEVSIAGKQAETDFDLAPYEMETYAMPSYGSAVSLPIKPEQESADFELVPYEMESFAMTETSSAEVTPMDVAKLLYRTPGTPPAEYPHHPQQHPQQHQSNESQQARQRATLTLNTDLSAFTEEHDTGISPSQLTSYSMTSLATSTVSLEPAFSSPTSPPNWESDFEEDRYLN